MLIRFEGAGVAFRGHVALHPLNWELSEGERWVIVGESGAGKTTFARLAAGLQPPSSGKVFWWGEPLSPPVLRRHRVAVQYVHQDPYGALHPGKTVFQILADPVRYHRRLRGKALRQEAEELLRRVGLTPPQYFLDKYPHHLSGGGRQRLAIARALGVQPRVLLADEPVSMVDMSLRAAILALFKEVQASLGIATVLVLHDLGAARFFAEDDGKVLVLYRGYAVEEGRARALFTQPFHPYTALLLAASPRLPGTARSADARRYLVDTLAREENPETGGCPFASLCPWVQARCREERPLLREVEEGHKVACHRAEEVTTDLRKVVGG